MINDDVIVVIASIPSRRENLIGLCRDLVAQTVLPSAVMLLLDGYLPMHEELRALETTVRELFGRVEVECHTQACAAPRGPGERWRYLARHASRLVQEAGTGPRALEKARRPLAVVIDDDFRVGPEYIEKTIAGFDTPDDGTGSMVGMVAWAGIAWDTKAVFGPAPVDLWSACGGMSAVRVIALAGIETHPMADECFAVGGDDEALVAYWLWESFNDYRIVRPAGDAPIVSIMQYQFAVDAAHKQHNHRHFIQRIKLVQQYHWEIPEQLPWENPVAADPTRRPG
jgi:hypothetical protein